MKGKQKRAGRQARRTIHELGAASLTVSSPVLGEAAVGHRHGLTPLSLETSSPESRPLPRRVHNLEARDSTQPVKRRPGRRPDFTDAEKQNLQNQFETLLIADKQQTKRRTNKQSIRSIRDWLAPNKTVTDRAIEHQVIRPVLKKLRLSKRRK
jgi:hypothetical protein